ncbi:YCF48-related protein [Edaphobacter bradus]|uniref:YCF48-related protein n=1 Tax=Edaphobacter bradus TaxID=2259016 RepID=UPI0021E01489|nr:hypothetical protein [Edaphobacter bradus]
MPASTHIPVPYTASTMLSSFFACHSAAQRRNLLFVLGLCLLPTTLRAQWDLQDSHTTASLRGIHNAGGGVAWASGTNGTVLRTEDGGYLWQTCTTPPGAEHLDFRGIQAFDENTAIVMSSGKGDLSRLYKTTDGCKSWKLVFTNPDKEGFWDAFWMKALNGEGMLIGDPVDDRFAVFETKDGGTSWHQDQSRSLHLHGMSLGAFAASNSSLGKADRGNGDTRGPGVDFFPGFVTGGKDGAFLFERWEGPSHSKARYGRGLPGWPHPDWSPRRIPVAAGADSAGAFALALRFTGSPCQDCGFGAYWHLVAVGGDYAKSDVGIGTAAFSANDGGWTWTAATTPPHGYRSAVGYDSKTNTWITVGPNGTDISRDDGKNWTAFKPGPLDPPDADKNWNALSLPFVVGPNGRIGKLRGDALKP